jgi:hypothetical protein
LELKTKKLYDVRTERDDVANGETGTPTDYRTTEERNSDIARRTKPRDRMNPEEKQEEKNKCLAGNVTTTEGGTDGTNQPIECAEKGKTNTNNSWKSPELPPKEIQQP